MNIMKGAEAVSGNGTIDAGVLLIHGISGSPFEMAYLGGKLSEKGYHIEIPRLAGHGTTWQDLNKVKYRQWIDGIEEALESLKKRCRNVFVIGQSMGGALTLYLAENHPEVRGIALINHALLLNSPGLFFIPVLKYLIPYTEKTKGPVSRSIKDKSVQLVKYDKMPLKGVGEMLKMLKIVRKNIGKIRQPVLIFKSMEDSKLMGGEKNVNFTYDHISSEKKEIIWLENSYHIAARDFDKDIIADKCINFIENLWEDPHV